MHSKTANNNSGSSSGRSSGSGGGGGGGYNGDAGEGRKGWIPLGNLLAVVNSIGGAELQANDATPPPKSIKSNRVPIIIGGESRVNGVKVDRNQSFY